MITRAHIEPGLFGIVRPVLLLSEGIADRLDAKQLDSVFVHELSHARRRDNITAFLHLIVETIFWFHPVVWWVGARMLAEQEFACDEEVIGLGSDPSDYAEAILNVCEFCVVSPLVCVSSIAGPNLKTRIESIVNLRKPMTLNSLKRISLMAGAVLAIATPLLLGIMRPLLIEARPVLVEKEPVAAASVLPVFGLGAEPPLTRSVRKAAPLQKVPATGEPAQTKAVSVLRFEVASIKPFQESGALRGPTGRVLTRQICHGADSTAAAELRVPIGRCLFNNRTLVDLVNFAYPEIRFFSLPLEERITGGDGWVRASTFDIEAETENPATVTQEQLRQMVRNLIEERFKLSFHLTTKDHSGYALVVAPGGLKLQPSSGPGYPEPKPNGSGIRPFFAANVLMSFLVMPLGELIKAPIVDKTGIEGRYNIVLNCAESGDETAPSIFTILPEATGLKLEAQKVTLPVLVIDHAEKPEK